MTYSPKDIAKTAKIFHNIEMAANNFLFSSSFSTKHKKLSAEKCLKAIAEYRSLPLEIRHSLEADKDNHVSNIDELEMLCRKAK